MNKSHKQSEFEQEEKLLRKYRDFSQLDQQQIQVLKHRLLQKIAKVDSAKIRMQKITAGILALGLLLFSGVGTVSASSTSLPGDALFPIREYLEARELEKVETKEAKALLKLSHLESKLSQITERSVVPVEAAEYVDDEAAEIQSSYTFDDELTNQLNEFLNEESLMNKKTLLASMIGLAMMVQPVMAQETLDDVEPGVTPDLLFYVFDILEEKIELLLTLNPEKNIEKRLEFALEKLAEARAMSEVGDDDSTEEALDEYEEYVDEANEEAESSENEEQEVFSSRIAEATYKHVLILEDLLTRVPEQAKKGIENAIERSQNGNHKAIEAVTRRNNAKGAAMAAKQAEKRLERLKKLAEENGDVDTDGVEGEAEEAENEVELAESISDESDDEESDEVDEVVKEVHRKHVEVLQEVYEKVPEQAQKGIERALENAERNEERFLEKLQERQERKAMRRELRERRGDGEDEEENEVEIEEEDENDEEENEQEENEGENE